MSDWITGRQPTRADADINGQIVVRYDGAILKPWDAILPEEHWSHTSLYRHTTDPAPEPPAAEPAHDPGLSDWITDRQPSAEDADKDGEVIMLRRADGRGNGATGATDAYVDWRHVGPGVPWKHNPWPSTQGLLDTPVATESKPQPAPEPAAADRPALAVGQTWRRRDGEVVTIVKNGGTDEWPFETSDGNWYRPDGHYSAFRSHGLDLIELISEAPEPAPVSTARRFVSISRTILHNRSTLDAIDDEGIAWVLHPGATEWERLIALPAREVPAQ